MPGWAVITAILIPIILLTGLVLGELRQPATYSPISDTISSLAGLGAADRWIMVIGFVLLGLSYILTGIGLRPALLPGRVVIVFGGVFTLLSVFFPQPEQGASEIHGVVAGAGFVALAVWPAFAFRTEPEAPWSLRPAASLTATGVMVVLMFWFASELFSAGARIGLTERFMAGVEALWPVVVAVNARAVSPALQDVVPDEPT